MDAHFSNKIIFCIEAYFHLDGFVNRQNIWGSSNPHVIVEKKNASSMCHCLVWILGRRHHWTIHFENEAGQAVYVTGTQYRNMITQFSLPKLNDIDVDNMWFQQDSATFAYNP